jgi:diketogulonate reductase-like aldo/keto reductase
VTHEWNRILHGACLLPLESGFRHFDTAQIYKNEADIGMAPLFAGAE